MNELTIKLSDKEITVKTHSIEGQDLYKAQDLLKGYGFSIKKTNDTLRNWKDNSNTVESTALKPSDSKGLNYTVLKGRYGGTYLNKELLFELASYVSPEFNKATVKAFTHLIEGNTEEAISVAGQTVFDMETALAVNARWKKFCQWTHITFKEVHTFYGSNITRMVVDYTLGHKKVSNIKGKVDSTLIEKLVEQKNMEGVLAINAMLVLMGQSLKVPSTKRQLQTKEGKMELYADWKVLFNWRDNDPLLKAA